MVIFAFADRLKVVASLKVMPSEELDDVCTMSLRKMSSRRCSASEFLLRITVAMPVSLATLPIGSSDAAGTGVDESAAGAAGVGAGAEVGGFAAGAAVVPGSDEGWVCALTGVISMNALTSESASQSL